MYVGKVYIEPKDILDRLSEEDKNRFNQCAFTKAEIMSDNSVNISYVVFKDENEVEESQERQWNKTDTTPESEREILICLDDGKMWVGYYYDGFAINNYETEDSRRINVNKVLKWCYIH